MFSGCSDESLERGGSGGLVGLLELLSFMIQKNLMIPKPLVV